MTAGMPAHAPLAGESAVLSCEKLADQFAELRRFIDRRFSELGVEVHGAMQMVGFSEATLTEQLGHIHHQIAAVLATPALAGRNGGLELEAVVQTTESAAERILQAAEAIGDWAAANGRSAEASAQLIARVNAIFEACAFQDLTGQRTHRAIASLRQVETLLEALMARGAGSVPAENPPPPPAAEGGELDQEEIDRLLA